MHLVERHKHNLFLPEVSVMFWLVSNGRQYLESTSSMRIPPFFISRNVHLTLIFNSNDLLCSHIHTYILSKGVRSKCIFEQ